MRYRFAREGIDTIIGNHLEPGALTWSEVGLPVSWNANWYSNNLIGMASDIRREDDGWLTAEVKWNTKGEAMIEQVGFDVNDENGTIWLTIYVTDIVEQQRESYNGQRVVKQGILRSLFVTLSGEDPWTEGSFNPSPKSVAAIPENVLKETT